MRGTLVIVRAHGNQPALVKIWDADEDHVCVVSDGDYNQMLAGGSERNPAGFPREDVFQYNESVWNEWKKGKLDSLSLWGRLNLWKEDLYSKHHPRY